MSFKPGSASGEKYVPAKDQLWKLTPERLTLGTRVDYASKVDDLRPLFDKPKVMIRWAKRAAEIALKAIVPLLGKAGKTVQYDKFSLQRVASQKGVF